MTLAAVKKLQDREFRVEPAGAQSSFRQDLEQTSVPKAFHRIFALTVRNEHDEDVDVTLDDDAEFTYTVPQGAVDTLEPGKRDLRNYEVTAASNWDAGDVVIIERAIRWPSAPG